MIFTCGRQIQQFLQSSAHTSLTLSGTRDPKPRSPRPCFADCRPHKRIRCWGNSNSNSSSSSSSSSSSTCEAQGGLISYDYTGALHVVPAIVITLIFRCGSRFSGCGSSGALLWFLLHFLVVVLALPLLGVSLVGELVHVVSGKDTIQRLCPICHCLLG